MEHRNLENQLSGGIFVDPQSLTWMFIQARLWAVLDRLRIDWDESMKQTRQMLDIWASESSNQASSFQKILAYSL
jgi:hypothetical protein